MLHEVYFLYLMKLAVECFESLSQTLVTDVAMAGLGMKGDGFFG